ncbi:hypothetical protein BGX34_003914 [Mortierella sp. NVP85]|nr:hypothetical protein BGX34_003914 [Mortierella sp. NVP85]
MMDTSASPWAEAIENSEIDLLDVLIKGLKKTDSRPTVSSLETSHPSTIQPPLLSVHSDSIPKILQRRASTLLGIGFGESDTMMMTPLQLSILTLYTSTSTDKRKRADVVEMLESSAEEINGGNIGDKCNVLHLAAFLNLKSTMQVLIDHGGDPSIENGFGLSAEDILKAIPTLGLETSGLQEKQPEEARRVFQLAFDNDLDNCAAPPTLGETPHRGRVTDHSNKPTQEGPRKAAATEESTNRGEQVEKRQQQRLHTQAGYGSPNEADSEHISSPYQAGFRRTRSEPYPYHTNGEQPYPILKNRSQNNSGQQDFWPEDVQAYHDHTDPSSSRTKPSPSRKDTDAESGGSRKSKSVQWRPHKSIRTFRRHSNEEYHQSALETDSLHSVEYDEPMPDSPRASCFFDKPAELTPTQNHHSCSGPHGAANHYSHFSHNSAGSDMTSRDHHEPLRCATPTSRYFGSSDSDSYSDSDSDSSDDDGVNGSRPWTPIGLKRRSSCPVRENSEMSGRTQARNSAVSSPSEGGQSSSMLSIFKSASLANLKPSWWTKLSTPSRPQPNSTPTISAPLTFVHETGSSSLRSPQLYPDYESHSGEFTAQSSDRYQNEQESFESSDRPCAMKSTSSTSVGNSNLPIRTSRRSSSSDWSNSGSGCSESSGEGLACSPSRKESEGYVSSNRHDQDEKPTRNTPTSSSRGRDYWRKRKQVKVIMIPPRVSSSDSNSMLEREKQLDMDHSSEHEPSGSELPTAGGNVSDNDSRKRYAAYFDNDVQFSEENPSRYAFMEEALVNINRICDGLELNLPVPSENTMVSVRIDTGHEQVDTDYVPLGGLDMLFNQEFCL